MDILYASCAGLDVHKETVVACVRRRGAKGRVRQQTRTFGTMTGQLLELAEQGVTHVALESTGVYWKPTWNLLEKLFEILLVNAHLAEADLERVAGGVTPVVVLRGS